MKIGLAPGFALRLMLCAGLVGSAHAQEVVNYSANTYGAKGDGKTLNTKTIQAALDAAGGHGWHTTVTLEPGVYLTGALFVKSDETLVIPKGVTLLGSQDIKDYPEMPTRVAGIELTWPAALINVYQQHNVTITGEGTIDGDGKVFWDSYRELRKIDEPKGLRWASDYDAKRPRLVQVFDSSRVKIGAMKPGASLLLRRSGFWTVHLCYSHDVLVDGVTIRNNEDGKGPSTDGIDIDSSKGIEVANADIEVNDDALCLKAGRDSDGLRVNRPTEDVKIHESVVRAGAAGVTFGSETSGGFRNIEAWNIKTMEHVPNGILFKSAHTRGGFAENIKLHDFTIVGATHVLAITMNWNPSYSYAKIPDGLKDVPPYYKVMTTPVPEGNGIAHVHDVHIWNIKATGAKDVFDVAAYKEAPLERFQLDHWNVQAGEAGKIADAKNWKLSDMALTIADKSKVAVTDSVDVVGLP